MQHIMMTTSEANERGIRLVRDGAVEGYVTRGDLVTCSLTRARAIFVGVSPSGIAWLHYAARYVVASDADVAYSVTCGLLDGLHALAGEEARS